MKKAFFLLALLAAGGRLMAQTGGLTPLVTQQQPLAFLNVDTTLRSPSLKELTKMPEANVLKQLAALPNVTITPLDETKLIGPMEGYLTPIAVLPGNSKMPILKPLGNYNMPVAGKPRKKEQITFVP